MEPGVLVDGRFEIERRAGAGGMGVVYRARDRRGGFVALKVLRDPSPLAVERFSREATILSELEHPAIVRYVSHGITPEGEWYLAMEWLDGEDLHHYLWRQGVGVAEAIDVARRIAEALSTAHARGIVHRDIKPSNVFVVGGDLAHLKLLDFGVARFRETDRRATATGATLGTPGYMAPEQVRGERDVDARADVFSLGCVLFECLTGRPPFVGEHAMAVLAKILVAEPPRVREVRADVPEAIASLVERMLSKEAGLRPADGRMVAAELARVGEETTIAEGAPGRPGVAPPMLTTGERRIVPVLVLRPTTSTLGDTVGARVSTADDFTAATIAMDGALSAMRAAVNRFGAKLQPMIDGSMLVTLDEGGTARDQALRASACALALHAVDPAMPIAIATGRAQMGGGAPIGEALDRAARMLKREATDAPIHLDEATAGLLQDAFDVRTTSDGALVLGTARDEAGARTILGRATPCVGREADLASLEALLSHVVDEEVSRAVLVTAPPGVGKSRLRHELLRRIRARGAIEVWTARGEVMSAGSSFGVVVQLVRGAADVRDEDALDVRRRKLRARVARHVRPEDARRVADFLGEVCAIPSGDDVSPQLRAARGDAIVMGDQVRRAFEDFVVAEATAHPLAVVLDDLHWGDRASVSFLDAALRQANERRLLVVAFARPEIEDVFPRLWNERGLHHVRLAPLTRKASERLVREVLGADVDPSIVARIVEGASGNAFYLEELVRAHVEGRSDAMPETVLAMVEARLATMEPEARRVLRAASVFGDVFWTGGVHALVGGGLRGDRSSLAETPLKTATEEWIEELTRRELLVMHRGSRVQGEIEGGFRHALVREAAYAMLTDRDRALGHRLAGEWLESMGAMGPLEADALAEHFVRGAEPARAIVHLRRSAEAALEGNDFLGAVARADKAVACGAEGTLLGELRLIQAESHHWRGAQAEKETCALEAMRLSPKGSPTWSRAVGMAITAHRRLRKHDALVALATEVEGMLAEPDSPPGVIHAAAQTATQLLPVDPERGAAFFAKLRAAAARAERDLPTRAWLAAAAAIDALQRHDSVEQLERAREARDAFSEAGDLRNVAIQAINVSHACFNLGAVEEGEAIARDGLAVADRLGLRSVRPFLAGNLASLLVARGAVHLPEAFRLYEQAIAEGEAEGNVQIAAVMRTHLAHYAACSGELDRAETIGKPVFDAIDGVAPGEAVMARAVIAEILLARGRADDALGHARLAVEHAGPDHAGHLEPLPFAVLCEVLRARGDRDEALRVIDRARDDLLLRAESIRAPYAASFLARVPDHARVLHLAAALHALREAKQ